MNNGFLQSAIPPDWRQMNPSDADAQIGEAIAASKKNVEAIKSLRTEDMNFINTVRALDLCTSDLDRSWTYINHLQSVADTPELRKAVNRLTPEVSDFESSIALDDALYLAIRKFAETDEGKTLSGDRKKLLEETLLDFEESGANLPADKKARLREIDAQLALKTQKFSENVLDGTKVFKLHITDESELKGLPETSVALARKRAESKGKSGWIFTLEQPSYVPFMTYAENDSLREKMWREFTSVAESGRFSNWAVMREILELRAEEAAILGRANFADYILKRRMAKNGKRADDFVDELTRRFEKPFAAEWAELLTFARQKGYLKEGEKMPPWRTAYIVEKLRAEKYGFDPEAFRPYFPMPAVLKGMFEVCEKLYGLKIEKSRRENFAWRPRVELYEVFDSGGKTIGLFYVDFFPREEKRAGAWMNMLSPARCDSPALGVIAGNVSEGADGAPALLDMDEVETLFHEFGHLVHFFMMDSPEEGLRDVAWDFVELPSQIMENWCGDKNCLDLFARHWKTGEKIPDDLFAKYDKSKKFMGASASMRQLSFAKIDLEMHIDPKRFLEASTIEKEAQKVLNRYTRELSEVPQSILPRFTHLFGDPVGYAAGYYSYKWAEVLDADAFTRFEKEGILNPKVGREFAEKILKVGSTVAPDAAFRNFMGRDPDVEALVERSVEFEKA